MPYNLPPAADVYWRSFGVPAAQIPVGAVGTAGLRFLQYNEHRVGLIFHNNGAGAANDIFIGDQEFGFANALPLEIADGMFTPEWPPRNEMFVWKAGTPNFTYVEFVLQPFRQSVGQDGHVQRIRSNVQR